MEELDEARAGSPSWRSAGPGRARSRRRRAALGARDALTPLFRATIQPRDVGLGAATPSAACAPTTIAERLTVLRSERTSQQRAVAPGGGAAELAAAGHAAVPARGQQLAARGQAVVAQHAHGLALAPDPHQHARGLAEPHLRHPHAAAPAGAQRAGAVGARRRARSGPRRLATRTALVVVSNRR